MNYYYYYFEPTGYWGNKVILQVYVNPTDDGHAFMIDMKGELIKFAWAYPDYPYTRKVEEKDIPEDLLSCIKHGCYNIYIDQKDIPTTWPPIVGDWTWEDVLVQQPTFPPSLDTQFVKPKDYKIPEILKKFIDKDYMIL